MHLNDFCQKEMENNEVRKGAWTKEEDILLKNCINKYGEGNWHKVPLRAGLKRCRKSCRLRWLNYLRPNLKRGYFTKDEVDLIVRLHKLLGNRWSLIAGRLPGRTANDVKNFWNTHIAKKTSTKTMQDSIPAKDIIIKPLPRTFSKPKTLWSDEENINKAQSSSSRVNSSTVELPIQNDQLSEEEVDDCIRWWGNLLQMTENDHQPPFSFSDQDVTATPIMPNTNHSSNQDGFTNFMSLDVNVFGYSS